MSRPKVNYIMGAGRSGSTVLERLLASASGSVAVGEVATLWRRPLDQLTCSCGAPAPECGFWRKARAHAGLTDTALAELAALEHETIRHRRMISDAVSGRAWALSREVQHFLGMQANLFAAIAEISGATRIIDSSKAAPRAWALSDLMGVTILHLRRNPADVAASWRREKHDPSLGAPMRRPSFAAMARDWLTTELSARRLARTRPVIRIDYEALIADPAATIAPLGPLADGVKLQNGRMFTPDPDYHSLNGNPDRFRRGAITLKPATAPDLPRLDAAFARVTGAALNMAAP